jgi:hypothetical protein
VVAVDTRTLIGLVGLPVTKIVSATMAVTLVMTILRLVASTVTLRQDARTVMVVAMIDVVVEVVVVVVEDTMREILAALINMSNQGRAREMLVTEEALTAEVEFTKIVLSMIDTPVDNCDR